MLEKLYDTTYIVAACSKERFWRTFQVNMLKLIVEKQPENIAATCSPENDESEAFSYWDCWGMDRPDWEYRTKISVTNYKQRPDTNMLLKRFQRLLSSLPGYTSMVAHKVDSQ